MLAPVRPSKGPIDDTGQHGRDTVRHITRDRLFADGRHCDRLACPVGNGVDGLGLAAVAMGGGVA